MSIQGEHHGELVGFGSFKTDHAAFPYGRMSSRSR